MMMILGYMELDIVKWIKGPAMMAGELKLEM